MNEFAKFVIYGVIGGLITWRFSAFQKASERRRDFRDKISLLATKLSGMDTTSQHLTLTNLRESAELKHACVKIREDIRWWRKRTFDRAYNQVFGFGAWLKRERYEGENVENLKAHLHDTEQALAVIKELLASAN